MISGSSPSFQDNLTVLRAISAHLEKNPDKLKTEGVFRLSGTNTNIPIIKETILKNKEVDLSDKSVHDLIGTLKSCFKTELLKPNDPEVVKLKTALNEKMDGTAKSDLALTSAVHTFIFDLMQSGDPHKMNVAEILYTYFHLARLASKESASNKMGTSNLGIVLGAILTNIVPLETNLAKLQESIFKMNAVCTLMLDSERYDTPFDPMTFRRSGTRFDTDAVKKMMDEQSSLEAKSSSGSGESTPLSASTQSSRESSPMREDFSKLRVKEQLAQLQMKGKTGTEIVKHFYDNRANLSEDQQKDLGDILGEKTNKALLSEYVKQFQFTNKEVAPALKDFLEKAGFRLPGEAQKIDRVMEAFAEEYVRQNSAQPLKNDDIYLFAFALIMLNTDLNNSQVKKKMTLDQFHKQFKGTPIEPLTDFQNNAYDFIKNNPIQFQGKAEAPAPTEKEASTKGTKILKRFTSAFGKKDKIPESDDASQKKKTKP